MRVRPLQRRTVIFFISFLSESLNYIFFFFPILCYFLRISDLQILLEQMFMMKMGHIHRSFWGWGLRARAPRVPPWRLAFFRAFFAKKRLKKISGKKIFSEKIFVDENWEIFLGRVRKTSKNAINKIFRHTHPPTPRQPPLEISKPPAHWSRMKSFRSEIILMHLWSLDNPIDTIKCKKLG